MINADVRFRSLWHDLNLSNQPTDTFLWLEKQYGAPDRHYHTFDHIEYGLHAIDLIGKPIFESLADGGKLALGAIKFAFWFHDSCSTERLSSNIAKFVLWTNRRPDLCGAVEKLINLTNHSLVPLNTVERVMVDSDLAIFAASDSEFDLYEANVRKEYPQADEKQFATARLEILRRFLERESIYFSIFARREWEEKARNNLNRSIEKLSVCLG